MSWREKANCKGKTELFFGPPNAEAQDLCRRCPVHYHCLNEAIEWDIAVDKRGGHDEYKEHGVWAGTTRGERAAIVEMRLRG